MQYHMIELDTVDERNALRAVAERMAHLGGNLLANGEGARARVIEKRLDKRKVVCVDGRKESKDGVVGDKGKIQGVKVTVGGGGREGRRRSGSGVGQGRGVCEGAMLNDTTMFNLQLAGADVLNGRLEGGMVEAKLTRRHSTKLEVVHVRQVCVPVVNVLYKEIEREKEMREGERNKVIKSE